MSLLLRRGVISSGKGGVFAVNSANLDGSTQWFTTPDTGVLDTTGDMTLNIWVKPSIAIPSPGQEQGLLVKWSGGGNASYNLYLLEGKPSIAVSDDGTNFTEVTDTILTVNTWNMLTARLNGTTLSISTNAGTPVTDTHTGGVFNSTKEVIVGAWQAGTSDFRSLDGSLARPLVISRALSDLEVTNLYKIGVPKCYNSIDAAVKADVVYAPSLYNNGITLGNELVDNSSSGLTTTNVGSTPFTGTGLSVEC